MSTFIIYLLSVRNPPKITDAYLEDVAMAIGIYMNGDTNDFLKFGVKLMPHKELDVATINRECKTERAKCDKLIRLWLSDSRDPKWEQVIEALQQSGFNGAATELTKALSNLKQSQGEL